jgi:hypothetical protein
LRKNESTSEYSTWQNNHENQKTGEQNSEQAHHEKRNQVRSKKRDQETLDLAK